MSFKDNYTTTAIKTSISADKEKSTDEKTAEDKKIVVSEEAFLSAQMTQDLINKLEQLRISSLMR